MLPVENFVHFINQHQLFPAQGRVLAAVSGGRDSVLMVRLLKAAGYPFGIAHCNFQLRGGEAEADELFCRELAGQLSVPFHCMKFDTLVYAANRKVSVQMAARELRYQWFEQVRQQHNYDVIALAQHQNDTIETILLNLVRGTGIAGLHGIQPLNGYKVRPMLFLTRQEIDHWVTLNRLPYREDSSNASGKYARNKLRLEVVPRLKEINPGLEKTFERNLVHFNELEALLRRQAAEAKAKIFTYDGDTISLSIPAIRQLPVQRLLLYELLKEYGYNETTIDDLTAALTKHSGRLFESATHRLVVDRERLLLTRKLPATTDEVAVNRHDDSVVFNRHRLILSHANLSNISNSRAVAMVDARLLHYPLTLRNWREGDYFYPLGMNVRKKLSDFFINQKVPLTQKRFIPLLVNGNGEIIWVAGYRLDNRYKVSTQTEKVTIFEIQNNDGE